jgi:hypothetical protein
MATPANHGVAMMAVVLRREVRMFRGSQFDSPCAVYAIALTTEVVASAVGQTASQPLARWELPAPRKMAGMGV